MDIIFCSEDGVFNYRACAVIVHNDHILAMRDGRSPYYYLPGGRVQLNETAEAAVLREIKEELGVDAAIVRPLWLNQGFFKEDVSGDAYHEICLYYLVDVSATDLLSRGASFVCHDGGKELHFEWLPFDTLKTTYFYPLFLKDKIFNLPDSLTILEEHE